MATTALVSYSVSTNTTRSPRTPRNKRRNWRRIIARSKNLSPPILQPQQFSPLCRQPYEYLVPVYEPISFLRANHCASFQYQTPQQQQQQQILTSSASLILPDVITDCNLSSVRRTLQFDNTPSEFTSSCKQIAHALRLVADQVDRKYCQEEIFNNGLTKMSIRIVIRLPHIRTYINALWSRFYLQSFINLLFGSKSF
ncbi:unnamed protein product [Didymodactylos carnosus]|uniref:Uncharacterized protein n=1 Tax=Didymodactylos carnosus TaxID=1234261 RepID=A0A813ZFP0_9BILA|nr:unnamed protein product [Didymodactylos carnosus]CAF1101724.1 unnamed protein product [Didymodactylos carnosus]CAF3680780.1 unnamed protein product [Didymodactylos carnosus]CAF3863088.1 unnamed protein product [Didymodactylos carnosus]